MILVSKNNDHVVLSSEEISIGVDDTSFPNTMRIRAESKTKLSDVNWGFAATLGNLHKTVNICVHLNCYVSTSSFPKRGLLKIYLLLFRFWSGSQDHITCGKRNRCCSYLHLAEKFCYQPRFKVPWILFHLCFVSDCFFFPSSLSN